MRSKLQRISVVDDEVSVRRAMERLLRSAGMSVATFATSAEFFEDLLTHEVDCVVLDLHMPEESGFSVLARLRASGRNLPVVVITGHDTPESRGRSFQAGANAYLLKPVGEEVLLKTIAEAIEESGGP